MTSELSPKASEIVAYTQSLLAAGGYNGFSYADIADAVHISKPSVHHHFASKAVLVRTAVQLYREASRAGMAALEKRDPLAQLQAYTGYWAACIADGSAPFCVCAMLAAELPAIPPEVAVEVRGHFSDLEAWLQRVLTRGAADGVFQLQGSPESEARAMMAAVHGAMLAARVHGDPALFAAIVKPAVRRLVRRA